MLYQSELMRRKHEFVSSPLKLLIYSEQGQKNSLRVCGRLFRDFVYCRVLEGNWCRGVEATEFAESLMRI